MSVSRESKRSVWLGVAAFLGTFLFIPLWDMFALVYAILAGWRARQDARRGEEGLAVLVQPLRRLLFLGIAFALALGGFKLLLGSMKQPGPFGFVITGANHYAEFVPEDQACCDISTAVAIGKPTGPLVAERLANSLWLLGSISVAGAILSALLVAVALFVHRLTQRRETAGSAVYSLLRLGAFRFLAPPVAGMGLVAVLFLVINFRWFPFGSAVSFPAPEGGFTLIVDRIQHVILPGFVGAMLPALIAAQAGVRAWVDSEEQGQPEPARWGMLGMEVARVFYELAGWIIGGLLVLESVFAYPGLGTLLIDAVFKGDGAVLVKAMQAFPLLLLVPYIRSAITASAQRAFAFGNTPPEEQVTRKKKKKAAGDRVIEGERPRPIDKLWLVVAGFLVLVLLITIIRGAFPPYDPGRSISQAPYDIASPDHPMGTDQFGRDVQSRVLQARGVTVGVALGGGLIALALGGIWGGISTLIRRWRGVYGESLADLIRIPADAALLLHPMLIVIAFSVNTFSNPIESGAGQSLAGVGMAIGLALTPRMAWAVESAWESTPQTRPFQWRLGGTLVVLFTAAIFAAFQYSVAVDFLNVGIVSIRAASLGNLLIDYQQIRAGTMAVTDARFHLLAVRLAGAAAIPALTLYVLQDALTDFFAFRRKGVLSRLFR